MKTPDLNNPPCGRIRDFAGTVSAGDPDRGQHCSVSTCRPCYFRSKAWVELRTGLPASELKPFPRRRSQDEKSAEVISLMTGVSQKRSMEVMQELRKRGWKVDDA